MNHSVTLSSDRLCPNTGRRPIGEENGKEEKEEEKRTFLCSGI
jgi:hypothetical protein